MKAEKLNDAQLALFIINCAFMRELFVKDVGADPDYTNVGRYISMNRGKLQLLIDRVLNNEI